MGLIGRPLTYHPDRPATTAERQRRFRQQRVEEGHRVRQQLASLEAKLTQRAYHQSRKHDWETPWHVFDPYNDEFAFSLDVCAEAHTTKCARYFSPGVDGLAQDWGEGDLLAESALRDPDWCVDGESLPERSGWRHGRVSRALTHRDALVACLGAGQGRIRHRKGRITFVGAPNPAGFASVAVIYRPTP